MGRYTTISASRAWPHIRYQGRPGFYGAFHRCRPGATQHSRECRRARRDQDSHLEAWTPGVGFRGRIREGREVHLVRGAAWAMGEPEDFAKAVLFLASDDSSYVNAVELMVDGGATGAPFGAPILRG